MSKILAVFGATGHQGGSVIANVLADAELSKEYKIRAITRDVNTEKLKHLHGKVEIVQGDATDRDSVEKAVAGAHTAFIMTSPAYTTDMVEGEVQQGKTMADAAVKEGLKYIIFSTLPGVDKLSNGKYTKASSFDSKVIIEEYIRNLPIQSAFISMPSYMDNFVTLPFFFPKRQEDGSWVIAWHISPQTELPLVDAIADTGKFVNAILAEPDKFEGKIFAVVQAIYKLEEIAAALSRSTGERVVYKQISEEEFRNSMEFIPELVFDAFSFGQEFGHYGPGTKEMVAWSIENARGRLTTFDEYLEKNPLKLTHDENRN